MDDDDLRHLRAAIVEARRARDRGDGPHGAVLVDDGGAVVAAAGNTAVTANDYTGHAELNVVRDAHRRLGAAGLRRCTLYASTEPCPMCAAAAYAGGIRRVVYAIDAEQVSALTGAARELTLTCREVFARGREAVEVIGPALADEAGQNFRETP